MHDTARSDYRQRSVGEVVAEDYARAAVFKRFGIDFCCGGGKTVGAACEQAGVSYDDVEAALAQVGASREAHHEADAATTWDLDLLVAYIEKTHHRYVRRTLPPLQALAAKVAMRHGDAHPELVEIRDLVAELASEMERHMGDEEQTLFPRIAALALGAADGAAPAFPNDASLDDFVHAMEDDHEHAGALMRRIRELSGDYQPPEGACASYQAAFAILAEFEDDLHRHVHLENNLLFPGAARLLKRRSPEHAGAEQPA